MEMKLLALVLILVILWLIFTEKGRGLIGSFAAKVTG